MVELYRLDHAGGTARSWYVPRNAHLSARYPDAPTVAACRVYTRAVAWRDVSLHAAAGYRGADAPLPHARGSLRRPASQVARGMADARPVASRAHPRDGGPAADAGAHPAESRRVRRADARRLHGLQGVLRKPSGVPGHGESVQAHRRRAVPRHRVAPWPLELRAAREQRGCVGPGSRDQPRTPGLRGLHLRHDRLQRQPVVPAQSQSHVPRSRVRRQAREFVGPEPRGPATLEQYPFRRLSRVAPHRSRAIASARQARPGAGPRPSCCQRSTTASRRPPR